VGIDTLIPIEQLRPDPRNARKHGDRNKEMLESSLSDVGAARSIVIDENDTILAGNATVEAAQQIGIGRVQVVEADGQTIIAVRRRGLTEEQKLRLALYDNRAAELAEWDTIVLGELNEEIDLSGMFNEEELKVLFEQMEPAEPEGGGDDFDTTPAEPSEGPTRASKGDLWLLGRHRVLCGDSTNPEDVRRLLSGAVPDLMITDPPYGVDYDPGWRNEAAEKGLIGYGARREGKVENDDRASWLDAWKLFPGSVVYCWHAGVHATQVATDLEAAGFEIRSQIIWAKNNFAISRGHYHWKHEPCWYAVRKGSTASWIGDRSQTTLWEIDQSTDGQKTDHGTQKPLECMARPIRNHEGDVYDPFLGSGTTLIAAHRAGRRCFGMEIDPRYLDVILKRYEAETGEEPVLERRE
jgi:DNA modification methylase